MTNRFQKFAFSVNSTRPHEADTVSVFKSLRFHSFRPSTRHRYCSVFKSFHSGDRFRKFAFPSKTIHRFHCFRVDGTPKTQQCLRFQLKTHPCGRGRQHLISILIKSCSARGSLNSQPLLGSCPGSLGRDRGNEPKSVWEFRLCTRAFGHVSKRITK